MAGLYYGLGVLVLIAIVSLYFLAKTKKLNINIDLMVKVLAYVLMVVFFFRYMWANNAIQDMFELQSSASDSKLFNAVALILNWFMYAVILIMCMYPFFKKIKGIEVLVKYFALPFGIIAFGFYFLLGRAIAGPTAFVRFDTRVLLMAFEFGIILGSGFIIFMENGKFKSSKKSLKLLWFIPLALLSVMPFYTIQGLFGYDNSTIKIKGMTLPHRTMLYFAFIIPFALFFLLRKKEKPLIKFSLLFVSLGVLLSFSFGHRFASFLDVSGWPIHLCNTALYIIPLCIIFKWDKVFYFTYFINVLGAFLAMAMPNFADTTNLLSTRCIEFFTSHYIAFFMPLLIVALRLYDRPKLREFKYSMVGFAIYFLVVLICNAWFSNYGTVDYFFVNSDFIADKLGLWAENLRLNVWTFKISGLTFTYYPLYQFLFFVVYVILGLAVWFLYEAAYSFADTIEDIVKRKQKIKLDQIALEVALNGRGKDEPMNSEGENKIILRNFSKRYGKSSVYAVKDANMEINGGEIFGFLGHNGAGKSTIIKSIVGIQPITSGSIEVCGYDVDKQPVMAKKQIGYVPDHYALYEKLTGREYINYIADLYDVSKNERDARIDKFVKLFELQTAFDNQIKTYSHGMKQKIAIMSALVHNPRVWILDEPLTGLDPNSIFQVKECMREHAKAGNIVFFSSHLIDIVEQLCDKIAIIKKGNILVTKSVKDIEKDTTLEKFYLKMTNMEIEVNKVESDNKEDKNEKETSIKKVKSKKVKG